MKHAYLLFKIGVAAAVLVAIPVAWIFYPDKTVEIPYSTAIALCGVLAMALLELPETIQGIRTKSKELKDLRARNED